VQDYGMDFNNALTPPHPQQSSALGMECEDFSSQQENPVKKHVTEYDFDTMRTIMQSAGLKKNQCVFLQKDFIAAVHSNGYY